MKTGIELIAAERARQILSEGYREQHDDEHTHGQIAAAAITYADTALANISYDADHQGAAIVEIMATRWPWDEEAFKPSGNPIRNLVKAGALIAAEIDRLQREDARKQPNP